MPGESRPTLERKIHFYRAHTPPHDGEEHVFDAREALRAIGTLSFENGDRYLRLEEGQVLSCWPDRVSRPPKLVLGAVRRTALPRLERAGRFRDLRIPASSGLVEATHVVFFPNAIVGADFNFYGPRLSRLSRYLLDKVDGLEVDFMPLLRQDVMDQLDQLRDVRTLQFRARASFAHSIRRASASLGAAFEAAQRAGQAEDVEVVLRMRPHSRRALRGNILDVVRRLARLPNLREEASSFVVKGATSGESHVEVIDVLRDHLIAVRRIVRVNERSRALDPESAYAAIIEAHNEMRDELRDASSIGGT